jgi:poly-gamma-glutamate capsule biosynthesis protein CapA/YwtB (metallophosphatase superfamily)
VAAHHAGADWQTALSALAPCIAGADWALANLESPLTTAPQMREAFDLRAPPQAVKALRSAGIQTVSLANNHALDAGIAGLEETMRVLHAAGITPLLPAQPVILKISDLALAFVALDDTLAPLQEHQVVQILASARQQADLMVVSIHWGSEYASYPNPRQRELAALLASAGADIIIGHHPHVLQPVEWVWGSQRGHPTLVAFSLGNALFDQTAPPAVRQGGLLVVEVGAGGARRASVVPFQITPASGSVAPPSPATLQGVPRITGLPIYDGCSPPVSP